jgi:hypothetical protein
MSLQIVSPFQQFFDRDGSPLDSGFIYVGTANLNPETNPLTVYFDDALTIPAAQPLRTSNGYVVRNGSPARVYTSQEDFSLTVRSKNSVLVFTVADATAASQLASSSGSSLVGYNQGGANAVTRTVQARLRDFVSVKDFGAVGNNVANDTAAITAAIATGSSIYFPAGTYKVTADINVSSNTRISGDGIGKTIIAADVPTNGDLFIHPNGVSNVEFSGITFRGNPTQNGAGNKAFGVYVEGSNSIRFDSCSFDTFSTHSLTIRKASGTWIAGGVENSQTSVDNLLAKSCQNVWVVNCLFDYAGSNHFAAFGVSGLHITGCVFTENTTNTDVLIDDASQTTVLQDYAVNTNVFIDNCQGTTSCRLDGCATGSVSNSKFGLIKSRSYDFDQQKLNLTRPFFWFNYLDRGIRIQGNICNQIETRTGDSVSVVGNTVTSTASADKLIVLANNGLAWGGVVGTIFDNTTTSAESTVNQTATGNTLVSLHASVIGITYGAINAQQYASCLSNTAVVYNGGSFADVILEPNDNWTYSYALGSTHIDQGKLFRAVVPTQTANMGVLLDQGVSKARLQGAPFSTDYWLASNWNAYSDTIDSSAYYAVGEKFGSSTGTWNVAVGAAVNTSPTAYLTVDNTGATYPASTTGTQNLGIASKRWKEVFAANGTINTSDERQKQDIRDLSAAETAVAIRLKSLVKAFRYKDAVALKGDAARVHVGVIAQEVKAAFEAEGLDGFEYGILCYDQWGQKLDEEKNVLIEAGDSFGIRYSELAMFIIAAI